MEKNEDLIRLAGVVEELLANYNQLKMEKKDLIRTVAERDQYISELQGVISRMKDEKADVSQRVSGILAALENWEKGHGEEPTKSPEANSL